MARARGCYGQHRRPPLKLSVNYGRHRRPLSSCDAAAMSLDDAALEATVLDSMNPTERSDMLSKRSGGSYNSSRASGYFEEETPGIRLPPERVSEFSFANNFSSVQNSSAVGLLCLTGLVFGIFIRRQCRPLVHALDTRTAGAAVAPARSSRG